MLSESVCSDCSIMTKDSIYIHNLDINSFYLILHFILFQNLAFFSAIFHFVRLTFTSKFKYQMDDSIQQLMLGLFPHDGKHIMAKT